MENVKFRDLPEYRQQKILSNHIEGFEEFWNEYIIEEFKDELEQHGFRNPIITYSGFYNQGDGASFVSDYLDLSEFVKADPNIDIVHFNDDELTKLILDTFDDTIESRDTVIDQLIEMEYFRISVDRTNFRYYHSNSVKVSVDMENFTIDTNNDIDEYIFSPETGTRVKEFYEYLEQYLNEWVKDKCDELYKRLERGWQLLQETEMDHLLDINDEYPA